MPGLPGAATRAHSRQVGPGSRALLSAPAGHLPAAGWGLKRGGRAGGVSVRLFQVPELRVGNAQGRARPAVVGASKMLLFLDQSAVPRTSSLGPEGTRGARRRGRRSPHGCQGRQLSGFSPFLSPSRWMGSARLGPWRESPDFP